MAELKSWQTAIELTKEQVAKVPENARGFLNGGTTLIVSDIKNPAFAKHMEEKYAKRKEKMKERLQKTRDLGMKRGINKAKELVRETRRVERLESRKKRLIAMQKQIEKDVKKLESSSKVTGK